MFIFLKSFYQRHIEIFMGKMTHNLVLALNTGISQFTVLHFIVLCR